MFDIFGHTQLVALLMNSFILVLNSILAYWLGNEIYDNKKYGFWASLIYIFWPANIFYSIIFTQEHLCAFCFLTVSLLFIKIIKKRNVNLYRYGIVLLIGFLLGLSTFLKNFAPIFLIAFLIFYFMIVLKEKIMKTSIITFIFDFLIIILMFNLTNVVLFKFCDNLVGEPVSRNSAPYYIFIGLNKEGKGIFDEKLYNYYFNLLDTNDNDFEKTNKEVMDLTLKELKLDDAFSEN